MLLTILLHFSFFMHYQNALFNVPTIIFIKKKKCSMNMNALSVDDDSDDDNADGDNEAPSSLNKLIVANGSIFDDDMIEKYTTEEGNARWKCKWCNNTFASWNATKAIYHLNKMSKDIRPCTARIESDHAKKYSLFLEVIAKKRSRAIVTTDHLDRSMSSHNLITATTLDGDRRKKSKGNSNTMNRSSNSTNTAFFTNNEIMLDQNGSTSVSTTTGFSPQTMEDKNDSRSYLQLKIIDAPNPTAESKLTMAIADMIHSLGLSFSLSSEPKFRHVLRLAKAVPTQYNPPSRNQVAGELLDLNYSQNLKQSKELLVKDINIYGLTYYGDGATVKRMPLINILASGVHNLVAVLEIVNTTSQCEEGGKKDARFIASLFRPHIDDMESSYPNSTDVLFFDGASNVQLAGTIIEAKYPRIITLHGAEHVISLFFSDIFKFPQMRNLYRIAQKAYRVFGSGSMHAPYAIFQKHSKLHNGGKNIGLMRAAGTRMAGNAIVMMRFIRLRNALVSTVTSPEFIKLKVRFPFR